MPAAPDTATGPGRPVAPIDPGIDPGIDPALVRAAAEAKAAGKVLDVADPTKVTGCKDLGQTSEDSPVAGMVGRTRIRVKLRKIGAARGASHLYFSNYRDRRLQSEDASFYDCTPPKIGGGPGDVGADADHAGFHGAIAVQVELVPVGSLSTNAFGTSQSFDISTTYGISGGLDYFVAPFLAIGAVPGAVLNLKGKDGTESATQLDLRARLSLGDFSHREHVVGYVTVGGSWIYLPGDITSSGRTLGFGLAAYISVGNAGFISFDAGYQFGSQTVSMGSVDVDAASNLLHFGFGFGSYL